jgi:hypothetical protein
LVPVAQKKAAQAFGFEAMLQGWRRQQVSRRLSGPLIDGRERIVRRFAEFTNAWPWQWTPAQVEVWTAAGGWAHSTVRSYQGALSVFLAYVCDPRYGWVAECEQQVGARLPGPARVWGDLVMSETRRFEARSSAFAQVTSGLAVSRRRWSRHGNESRRCHSAG